MADFVVTLANVRAADASRVGYKAAALGDLLADGFPVPPGFCLTTVAFHLAIASVQTAISSLLTRRDAPPADVALVASQIRSLIDDLKLPEIVRTSLGDALRELNLENTLLAVRSSATAEDRPDASFAGQYLTQLGVRGMAAVEEAVLACWRSFFSANALVARAKAGDWMPDDGMAVLIQPLIRADCAGVCFSLDPVEPVNDQIVINAAWGIGAGVVDGRIVADTAWVRRHDLVVTRQHVAEKVERITIDKDNQVCQQAIPAEMRMVACLPESWLVRVAQLLTGIGASPGQVSGRARLMTNAHQLPDLLEGNILVADNIGPRWTPIFSILGGLVLNSGSVGQHAASTAREYGVPAVIATWRATEQIADGAWITLNGTTGVVTMV